MSDVFFNSKKLPNPKREYVAFVDIMGTRAHMENNVTTTANYIFKLHAAILAAWRNEKYQNVFVYPVMDGAYITATSRDDIFQRFELPAHKWICPELWVQRQSCPEGLPVCR